MRKRAVLVRTIPLAAALLAQAVQTVNPVMATISSPLNKPEAEMKAPEKPKVGRQNLLVACGQDTLPAGIRSRFLTNVNGLNMHDLETGTPAGQKSIKDLSSPVKQFLA